MTPTKDPNPPERFPLFPPPQLAYREKHKKKGIYHEAGKPLVSDTELGVIYH